VIPVAGLSRGKTRLAPVLAPAQRMRLNRRLVLRTLGVVARWRGDLHQCIVVSPCARALRIAARAGAVPLREARPARGLNAAIRRAAGESIRRGARRVLVLSSDLPHLTVRALVALVRRAHVASGLTIATDRAGTGTNALVLRRNTRFGFCFGLDSRARHRDAARALGWALEVCACPELAFDLDTPQDLARLRGHRRAAGAASADGIV
jgi:2-phospho-L-lactate guanylyltransferase